MCTFSVGVGVEIFPLMRNLLRQLCRMPSSFLPAPSSACPLVLNKHEAWREGGSRWRPLLCVQGKQRKLGEMESPLVSWLQFWRCMQGGERCPGHLENPWRRGRGLFPGMYTSLSVQFHSPTGRRPFTCQEQPGEKTLNNFSLKNTALGHLSD